MKWHINFNMSGIYSINIKINIRNVEFSEELNENNLKVSKFIYIIIEEI